MKKRILVVEPQPLTRQGLALTLRAELDLDVCGLAASAAEALRVFEAEAPDLVITALDLPDRSGLELVEELVHRRPALRVLVLSRHAEALCAERALRAGAHGYAIKSDSAEEVVEAARRILAGGYTVSEAVLGEILEAIARSPHPLIPSPTDVLSEREMELFELIGDGLGTHEVAVRMALSIKTVESYRNRIKQKLNVGSMSELMRRAVMWKSPDHACMCWSRATPAELVEESTAAGACGCVEGV